MPGEVYGRRGAALGRCARLDEPADDIYFRGQSAVHRAGVGDGQEPGALLGGERAGELDVALDAGDQAHAGVAVGAIFGMDARVAKADADGGERHLLARRIQLECHRGASAEGGEKQGVGVGAGIGAAGGDRLVGQQAVAAGPDVLREAVRGPVDLYVAGGQRSVRRVAGRRLACHVVDASTG